MAEPEENATGVGVPCDPSTSAECTSGELPGWVWAVVGLGVVFVLEAYFRCRHGVGVFYALIAKLHPAPLLVMRNEGTQPAEPSYEMRKLSLIHI